MPRKKKMTEYLNSLFTDLSCFPNLSEPIMPRSSKNWYFPQRGRDRNCNFALYLYLQVFVVAKPYWNESYPLWKLRSIRTALYLCSKVQFTVVELYREGVTKLFHQMEVNETFILFYIWQMKENTPCPMCLHSIFFPRNGYFS